MTLVIMCLSLNLSRAKLQFRLGPIKSLNLGLFVNRQNQCIVRRIHIEPDNIAHFFSEVGIVADFERSEPVRLQISRLPDLTHLPARHSGMLRHEAEAPVCGLFRDLVDRVL